VDYNNPKSFNLPEGEADEGYKLAQMLRNIQLSGMGMDVGKAGTMMQGRAGYQFDPNEAGNSLGVGVSGQRFANNRYNIPAVINGVDVSYGGPNQSISAGYYPNKTQFMGEPMGKGGVSLMYRKSFD
jgi:hypothetical protein